MTRTYDSARLLPLSPTNLEWARTWVRFWLKSTPDEEGAWPETSPQDEELGAALALDAVTDGAVAYYRPHYTAARVYLGDAHLLASESAGSGYTKRRDANEIISAWLNQGRAFDALIPDVIVLPPFTPHDATPDNPGGSPAAPDTGGSVPLIVTGL